jgi:hypothetical protein
MKQLNEWHGFPPGSGITDIGKAEAFRELEIV